MKTCSSRACPRASFAWEFCLPHYREYRLETKVDLPVRPLLDYLSRRFPDDSIAEMGERVGRSRRQMERWRNGEVPALEYAKADEIMIALDSHPMFVWGEDYCP